MTYLQAIILGIFQGLTEFLPVSSTAHMAIVPQLLLGMADPGAAFSAVVQLGPIVAIIAYFRKDLARYLRGIARTASPTKIPDTDLDAKLGWYVLLGTLPLAFAGVLLEHWIDTKFRQMSVIAVALILLAVVLLIAEAMGQKKRKLDSLTLKESQMIGWAQILALVPGASRSGVTISAGLFLNLDHESATRFSFLLSIPAIAAAGLYKLFKVLKANHGLGGDAGPYLVGAVVAAAVAYVIVNWFLKYMEKHNTRWFIVWRIALGVLILVLLATGKISKNQPGAESTTSTTTTAQTTLNVSFVVDRG